MPHLATLQGSTFDQDVDDIRGATLYGLDGQKLGKVTDAVFDHNTGEISYLVVDLSHDRHVLVSVDGVRPSIQNDDDLDSDYTMEELAMLPAFEEKVLKHSDQWNAFEKLHRDATKREQKEGERAYDKEWEADPLQHHETSVAHNITPLEPAGTATPAGSGERQINAADLYPKRITGTPFTDTAPRSSKLTMVPEGAALRAQNQEPVRHNLESNMEGRLGRFRGQLRRNLNSIRSSCSVCCAQDERAA